MTIITSISEKQTIEIAEKISKTLQPGDLLCLYGNLGSGKSVFCRGLIRKISQNPQLTVPSPTFTLVQVYDTNTAPIWHFDLYRLKDADEVFELGWEDALAEGISLVEWPERIDDLALPDRLEIHFSLTNSNETHRTLALKPSGNWQERLSDIDL